MPHPNFVVVACLCIAAQKFDMTKSVILDTWRGEEEHRINSHRQM